jgi:hypothetical protein
LHLLPSRRASFAFCANTVNFLCSDPLLRGVPAGIMLTCKSGCDMPRACRIFHSKRVIMADSADYVADIKKYTSNVDEAAVAGMAKTYALVMSKPDTRYVAASDPDEVARVVENFCKKKLGRKESDADLTAAVKAQCEKMKADRTKSRITVYYLLAEHFKQLAMFHPK